MSKLTVIILNYNTCDLTVRAIKSCLELKFDLDVVVVDNHSTDNTVNTLRHLYKDNKRLSIMALDRNDGFSAGNNAALAKVKSTYVMLLNSDAYFESNAYLGSLISYLDTHQEVGVITPKVVLPNGKLDPASHRGFPTPWNAFTYYAGLEHLFPHSKFFAGYHLTWKDLKTRHEIQSCTGAAMIVRVKTIVQIGLLDEQFFMYGEDLDWCYRFWQAGFKIVYDPSVTVYHDKHQSGMKQKHDPSEGSKKEMSAKLKSRQAFFSAMKLFYKKHYTHVYPKFLHSLVFFGIDGVAYLTKRK